MPLTPGLLSKYPNPVFIETGSFVGDGIQAALDAGFEHVYSIELSEKFYNRCVKRFAHDARVVLYRGDSTEVLPRLLASINPNAPITFWLDGHYSEGETARGAKECPLLEELTEIFRTRGFGSQAQDTILIDDMRCWSMIHHGFDKEKLEVTLINAGWMVRFVDGQLPDGTVLPEDILVAVP